MECATDTFATPGSRGINIPSQCDAVRDAQQHVRSRIRLKVSFSTKNRGSGDLICQKTSVIMRYDLVGGRTRRRTAQSSSEGGRCPGLGTVENYVSISRTKFKSQKQKNDRKIKKENKQICGSFFVFSIFISYFSRFENENSRDILRM